MLSGGPHVPKHLGPPTSIRSEGPNISSLPAMAGTPVQIDLRTPRARRLSRSFTQSKTASCAATTAPSDSRASKPRPKPGTEVPAPLPKAKRRPPEPQAPRGRPQPPATLQKEGSQTEPPSPTAHRRHHQHQAPEPQGQLKGPPGPQPESQREPHPQTGRTSPRTNPHQSGGRNRHHPHQMPGQLGVPRPHPWWKTAGPVSKARKYSNRPENGPMTSRTGSGRRKTANLGPRP